MNEKSYLVILFLLMTILFPISWFLMDYSLLTLDFIPVAVNGLTTATSIATAVGIFLSQHLRIMKIIFMVSMYLVLLLIGIAYYSLAIGSLTIAFKLSFIAFIIMFCDYVVSLRLLFHKWASG